MNMFTQHMYMYMYIYHIYLCICIYIVGRPQPEAAQKLLFHLLLPEGRGGRNSFPWSIRPLNPACWCTHLSTSEG